MMGILSRIFGNKTSNKIESKKDEKVDPIYPFNTIVVSGDKALSAIQELQNKNQGYPVIMGDPEGLEIMLETLTDSNDSYDEIIRKSEKFNFIEWSEHRKNEFGDDWEFPHGEWSEIDNDNRDYTVPYNITNGKPLKKCLIGILDVKESWEVPAILKYGGWNECPLPSEHVAIFKKWEIEYSAKVICITSDIIEFKVYNPPKNKEDALKLAHEQYLYCSDIVEQGVETIEKLASTLINSDKWYFWWD